MPGDAETLILRLDGYEGPLDLLLELARAQKVDLAKISILALVEQFLAVIEGALRVRLELAADWLVMAAWLTWLKSRLLLPATGAADDEAPSAELLADRLAALQTVRAGAAWLAARPQLGTAVFARGEAEDMTQIDRSRLKLDLPALLGAYLGARRRAGAKRQYQPRPAPLFTIQNALAQLGRLLETLPDWSTLEAFLPAGLEQGPARRGAIAATLVAGLELARDGRLTLVQEHDFGPIRLRQARSAPDGR